MTTTFCAILLIQICERYLLIEYEFGGSAPKGKL
ncbi:hypothetical protein PL2TA16_00673 [Pseudoalteromonas luteoviolacea 2ta16]|uniref:Uncharacterized protein n=1 Tax=Pseudoalteromonas luteoviolacea (strain 2ta16) TaxID=1353533 RepID=V4HXY5_PSEL2|nr:hypothetical protein PL2TA16_00673 [Pseudoalteromonas luteoviolacea 2ta16]